MAMRKMAKLWGLACVLILSGCANLSSIPDIQLPGSGESLVDWGGADDAASDEQLAGNGAPPLPQRNIARTGAGSTRHAANASGGADGPLLSLPNLEDVEIFTAATAEPSRITSWDQKPVAVYTRLAKQIHSCWLNAAAPKLENHGFHAEVESGNAKKASIIIFQKHEGRRGLQSFRIEVHGTIGGSSVEAKNRRLEKSQDLAFRADISRWAQGDYTCAI